MKSYVGIIKKPRRFETECQQPIELVMKRKQKRQSRLQAHSQVTTGRDRKGGD